MHLIGQVIIKGPDGGDFPGSGCGIEAVFRIAAVLVLHAVTAEIGHIAIDIRQRDTGHEVQIHIHDVDLIQLLVRKRGVTNLFHVAEEIPQVQKVFVDRSLGMGFDGLMIGQKIPQDLRCFSAVINHRLLIRKYTAAAVRESMTKLPKTAKSLREAVFLSPKLNKIFILFNRVYLRKSPFPGLCS